MHPRPQVFGMQKVPIVQLSSTPTKLELFTSLIYYPYNILGDIWLSGHKATSLIIEKTTLGHADGNLFIKAPRIGLFGHKELIHPDLVLQNNLLWNK